VQVLSGSSLLRGSCGGGALRCIVEMSKRGGQEEERQARERDGHYMQRSCAHAWCLRQDSQFPVAVSLGDCVILLDLPNFLILAPRIYRPGARVGTCGVRETGASALTLPVYRCAEDSIVCRLQAFLCVQVFAPFTLISPTGPPPCGMTEEL